MKMERTKVFYGDIIYVNMGEGTGSEQKGLRPCVVVQNNTGNKFAPTTIVAPITSKVKKALPTHVKVEESERNGLKEASTILLEQIRCISKDRIIRKAGRIEDFYIPAIQKAFAISVSPDL